MWPGLGVIGLPDQTKRSTRHKSDTHPESVRHKWWRYPAKITIAAAKSREDLPDPWDAVEQMGIQSHEGADIWLSETPTTSMCRFIPNASEEQIADQQNEMLRGLLPCGPVVWAAYWGDSDDCELIWAQDGKLSDLYAHITGEVEFKIKAAESKPVNASVKPDLLTHSGDYRTVTLLRETYKLTSQQAQMIDVLHEAHKNGNPEVSIAYIQERLEKTSSRWQDTWKSNKKARVALIQSGERKGTLRLKL